MAIIVVAFVTICTSLTLVIGGIFGISSSSFFYELVKVIIGSAYIMFMVVYLYELYSSLKSLNKEDITISSFKGWLITFLVLGILSPIFIGILLITTLALSVQQLRNSIGQIQNSSSTPVQSQASQPQSEQFKKMQDMLNKMKNGINSKNTGNTEDNGVTNP